MKHQILKQEKNPFLEREEYLIEIEADSNPKFEDVQKIIGKEENSVVIKKLEGNFGRRKFITEVFVYDSEDAKKRVETIPKKIRKKMEDEEKARLEQEKKKKEEEAKAAEEAKEAEEAEKVKEAEDNAGSEESNEENKEVKPEESKEEVEEEKKAEDEKNESSEDVKGNVGEAKDGN